MAVVPALEQLDGGDSVVIALLFFHPHPPRRRLLWSPWWVYGAVGPGGGPCFVVGGEQVADHISLPQLVKIQHC